MTGDELNKNDSLSLSSFFHHHYSSRSSFLSVKRDELVYLSHQIIRILDILTHTFQRF